MPWYPSGRANYPRKILETLVKGCRDEARRQRRTPFDLWPGYGPDLVDLHGTGEELVIVVLRDLGARLRRVDGVAEIEIAKRAMRVPSKAAALAIAEAVERACGVLPDDHAIRRSMAILEERALGTPEAA